MADEKQEVKGLNSRSLKEQLLQDPTSFLTNNCLIIGMPTTGSWPDTNSVNLSISKNGTADRIVPSATSGAGEFLWLRTSREGVDVDYDFDLSRFPINEVALTATLTGCTLWINTAKTNIRHYFADYADRNALPIGGVGHCPNLNATADDPKSNRQGNFFIIRNASGPRFYLQIVHNDIMNGNHRVISVEEVFKADNSCCCCCRCYITTAVCHQLNLPDDCEELTLLRWYRDNVLLKTPQGQQAVAEYYATAPAIVQAINNNPHSAKIYERIYKNTLIAAVRAIKHNNFTSAFSLYRDLVNTLKKEYL